MIDGASMKKLITVAFAYDKDSQTSPQLAARADRNTIEYYLKNAFVCLKSCLEHNTDTDVMLVTNYDMDEEFKGRFLQAGIKICKVPFDKYTYPTDAMWRLAYYKLCALEYVVNELSYDKYINLDTDVYCVDSLDDAWEEMESGIMLYNVGHRLSHKDRQDIIEMTEPYFSERRNVVHYGGEIVGGTRQMLADFMEKCHDIYDRTYKTIKDAGIDNLGDEFILSIAASLTKVREAAPYLFRYWTIPSFFLVSSNWRNNSVCLWHLPAEKKRGMIKLYKFFLKHNSFPDKGRAAGMMGFRNIKRPVVLSDYPIRFENLIKRMKK